MQRYGTDKFEFQVIEEVESEKLKEKEQEFIETLKPTYNSNRANGFDFERRKKYCKEYEKSDKRKEQKKEYNKKYKKTEKGKKSQKKAQKEYQKSDKGKESHKKANNKYNNQLCSFNGATLTLNALRKRFKRKGLSNPTAEAKKYLLK